MGTEKTELIIEAQTTAAQAEIGELSDVFEGLRKNMDSVQGLQEVLALPDSLRKEYEGIQDAAAGYLKILKESEATSSYALTGDGHIMKIHFLAKGDDRQLPIALASMTSKYVRELFMEILNDHFAKHCPDIAPTAGYYKDGMRFLDDLKNADLDPSLTPTSLLVRQR